MEKYRIPKLFSVNTVYWFYLKNRGQISRYLEFINNSIFNMTNLISDIKSQCSRFATWINLLLKYLFRYPTCVAWKSVGALEGPSWNPTNLRSFAESWGAHKISKNHRATSRGTVKHNYFKKTLLHIHYNKKNIQLRVTTCSVAFPLDLAEYFRTRFNSDYLFIVIYFVVSIALANIRDCSLQFYFNENNIFWFLVICFWFYFVCDPTASDAFRALRIRA